MKGSLAARVLGICAVLVAMSAEGAEPKRSDRLVAVSEAVSLRVIEVGGAEKPPVVLVPGWCFTADIWSKQISALSDRYHIIAIDPRSQGRSTMLDHSNSPDDRATDLAGLLKALNLRKPVLVGWSQGVQDVAAFALKYGTADLAGLVFVDATVSPGAAGQDPKSAAQTFGRMPIYSSAPRDYLEAMMGYLFRKPLPESELDAIVTSAMRTPTSVAISNLVLDLYGKDYRAAFKRIQVPTLVIVAGTAPDKQEQMTQPIPNATHVVIEDAGHAVFYDEPGKFNEALSGFLAECAKGRGGT